MNKVGEITVKGLAYEDIIGILANNGYATEVFTPVQSKMIFAEMKHVIRIYDSEDSTKVGE